MASKWLLIMICILGLKAFSNCGGNEKYVEKKAALSVEKRSVKLKPFRVLIIIGDQWTDPMSYHIDPTRVKGTDFLDVVNMLGQTVRTLLDERLSAGTHEVEWNGRSDAGEPAPSGMYLYRIEAGDFVQGRSMTLLK